MTVPDDRRGRLHLQAIDDPAEAQLSEAILQRLADLPTHVDRYGRVAGIIPKAGSELADDDRRTSWLQTSHMVSVCMSMAVDNLEAFRSLVEPEPGHLVLRQSAHYPLLRSSLESASLALWLLHPAEQRTRITRLLQARWSDVQFAHSLATATASGIGMSTKEERSMAERVRRDAAKLKRRHTGQIGAIARAEGIGETEYSDGLPSYGAIIRDSTEATGLNGAFSDAIWRMISGFTHPSALRAAHYSKLEKVRENEDGTDFMITTTSVSLVHVSLLAAMTNLSSATTILGERSIRPAASR